MTTAPLSPYSTLFRAQVDTEALLGDTNTLDVTLASGITAHTHRCLNSSLPINYLEQGLRDNWYVLVQAAKNYDWTNSKQDTLVQVILTARDRGTLSHRITIDGEEKFEPLETRNGKIWSDLPFLIIDLIEAWRSTMTAQISAKHRRNLTAFIARLCAVGFGNDASAAIPLMLFQQTLEVSRPLLSDPTESEVLSFSELLPSLTAWLVHASDKLVSLSEKNWLLCPLSFPQTIEAAPGFMDMNPARFRAWRDRLEDLSLNDGVWEGLDPVASGEVRDEAARCRFMMMQAAARSSGVLYERGLFDWTDTPVDSDDEGEVDEEVNDEDVENREEIEDEECQ